jgi:hypothetical protein
MATGAITNMTVSAGGVAKATEVNLKLLRKSAGAEGTGRLHIRMLDNFD